MPKRLLRGIWGKGKTSVLAAPGQSLNKAVVSNRGIVNLSTRTTDATSGNLVAYYPFTTDLLDITGKTTLTTSAGSPALSTTQQRFGKSLRLGPSDSVDVNIPFDYTDVGASWLVEFWAYTETPGTDCQIVKPVGGVEGPYATSNSAGATTVGYYVGGAPTSAASDSTSGWKHFQFALIAGVRWADVNRNSGVLGAGASVGNVALRFGPAGSGGAVYIDGLTATRRVVTVTNSPYYEATVPPRPHLIASRFTDFVNAPLNYSLTANAGTTASALPYTAGANRIEHSALTLSRNGGALRLTGGEDVTFYTERFIDPTYARSWTIQLWARIAVAGPTYISLGNAGIIFSGTNVEFFVADSNLGSVDVILSGQGLTSGAWKHFAMERDGAFIYGYIDGVRVSANVLDTTQAPTFVSSPVNYFSLSADVGAETYLSDVLVSTVSLYQGGNFTPPQEIERYTTKAIARSTSGATLANPSVNLAGGAVVMASASGAMPTSHNLASASSGAASATGTLASFLAVAATGTATASADISVILTLAANASTVASASGGVATNKVLASAAAAVASAPSGLIIGKPLAASAVAVASASMPRFVEVHNLMGFANSYAALDDRTGDRLAYSGMGQLLEAISAGTNATAVADGPYGYVTTFSQYPDVDSYASTNALTFYPGAGGFTAEVWFRTSVLRAEGMTVFSIRSLFAASNEVMPLAIQVRPDGKITGYYAQGTNVTAPITLTSKSAVQFDGWVHVALVKDALNYRLYINGVLEASGTGASHPFTPSSPFANYADGSDTTSNKFVGEIGIPRITNTARYRADFIPVPNTALWPSRFWNTNGELVTPALGGAAVAVATALATLNGIIQLRTNAAGTASGTGDVKKALSLTGSATVTPILREWWTYGDPYWDKVALHLPFLDGPSGNTTVIDYSPRPKTAGIEKDAAWTGVTTADLYAGYAANTLGAETRFHGGTRVAFRGVNSSNVPWAVQVNSALLSAPLQAEFNYGSQDFTAEAWVVASDPTSEKLFDLGPLRVDRDATTAQVSMSVGGVIQQFNLTKTADVNGDTSFARYQASHIAAVRSGTKVFIYIDGQRVHTFTVAADAAAGDYTQPFRAGGDFSTTVINDARITIGVARYLGPRVIIPAYPLAIQQAGVAYSSYVNLTGGAIAASSGLGFVPPAWVRQSLLAGGATTIASAAGDLTGGSVAKDLAVNAAGTATASADVQKAVGLAAAPTAAAVATGSVSLNITLASNAADAASATGLLSSPKDLAATPSAAATATGTLQLAIVLGAAATAVATAFGALDKTVLLGSTPAATATATTTLNLGVPLGAMTTATAQATGNLKLTVSLGATSTATAQAAVDLSVIRPIAATPTATAVASAQLAVTKLLDTAAYAAAAATATLALSKAFASSAQAVASTHGDLDARFPFTIEPTRTIIVAGEGRTLIVDTEPSRTYVVMPGVLVVVGADSRVTAVAADPRSYLVAVGVLVLVGADVRTTPVLAAPTRTYAVPEPVRVVISFEDRSTIIEANGRVLNILEAA